MRCFNKSWLFLLNSNWKWATSLSILILVIIVYFSVTLSYSQGRRRAGHCLPCSFKREATGAEVTFFQNSIIGNFMVNKIYLIQIYCSHSRTHNNHNGFLNFLLLFLRSTLLLNKNKHIGEEFFVFYKFPFPSTFSLTLPLPLLRLLPAFYVIPYKVSISTDMIVEIQVTKLLTKLLAESHWR